MFSSQTIFSRPNKYCGYIIKQNVCFCTVQWTCSIQIAISLTTINRYIKLLVNTFIITALVTQLCIQTRIMSHRIRYTKCWLWMSSYYAPESCQYKHVLSALHGTSHQPNVSFNIARLIRLQVHLICVMYILNCHYICASKIYKTQYNNEPNI